MIFYQMMFHQMTLHQMKDSSNYVTGNFRASFLTTRVSGRNFTERIFGRNVVARFCRTTNAFTRVFTSTSSFYRSTSMRSSSRWSSTTGTGSYNTCLNQTRLRKRRSVLFPFATHNFLSGKISVKTLALLAGNCWQQRSSRETWNWVNPAPGSKVLSIPRSIDFFFNKSNFVNSYNTESGCTTDTWTRI